MSLKALGLQVVLPKVFEAERIARRKKQQAQLHHDLGYEATLKESERNKNRTLKLFKIANFKKENEKKSKKEREK